MTISEISHTHRYHTGRNKHELNEVQILKFRNILSTILFVCVSTVVSHYAIQSNFIIYSSVYELLSKCGFQQSAKALSELVFLTFISKAFSSFKYAFVALCWILGLALTFWSFYTGIRNRTSRKIVSLFINLSRNSLFLQNVVPIIFLSIFTALIAFYLKANFMSVAEAGEVSNEEKTAFPNFILVCYFMVNNKNDKLYSSNDYAILACIDRVHYVWSLLVLLWPALHFEFNLRIVNSTHTFDFSNSIGVLYLQFWYCQKCSEITSREVTFEMSKN